MVRELRSTGSRWAAASPGHIRVAFEVEDNEGAKRRLVDAGAEVIAAPARTPWNSLNARLRAPAGLRLTLFEELG